MSSTSKAKTAGSPSPAWIASLRDPALAADFATFASSGTITEADVAEAMSDLAAELTASSSTLSSSQLADLQSIAINIGSLGASAYLQYIVNAFVNGNPANAEWTGGGATPTALGNLAAGATATELNELIGKWFLGDDLPSDIVSMSGSSTFTVTYSAVATPLFSLGGPSMADVNQGYLGDCYLLSALAEVAHQDPSLIRSMITDNGDNTYGVRFFVDGVARYVTVDNQLPNGGAIFNSGPAIWASLVEEAYAEAQAGGIITGNSINDGNSFSSIGNGGAPEDTLLEITGASAITDFYASQTSWAQETLNNSLGYTGSKSGVSNNSALATIAASLAVGDDVILSSYTNATDSEGRTTLVADHAMSVYGFDAGAAKLEIRNPWGSASWQYWDTTFDVGMSALLGAGDAISIDNAGTATNVAGASALAASALQTMAQVVSFTVGDDVVDVKAEWSNLVADSKMTALHVHGSAGANNLNLTGLSATATINLDGDAASASLKAKSLTITGLADALTMGSGAETDDYALGGAGGVETIANFVSTRDHVDVTLNGGVLTQTILSGGDWLSSTTDLTHGILLAGVTSSQSLNIHDGVAVVS